MRVIGPLAALALTAMALAVYFIPPMKPSPPETVRQYAERMCRVDSWRVSFETCVEGRILQHLADRQRYGR